jgi:hypothetical protein
VSSSGAVNLFPFIDLFFFSFEADTGEILNNNNDSFKVHHELIEIEQNLNKSFSLKKRNEKQSVF